MANPQKENGYTPIANEILENICKFDFTAIQLKILMIVWRHSYGFRKKECQLSLADFVKLIGSDKSYVSRQLKKLIKMGILILLENSNFTNSKTIMFNKDYEGWCCTRVQQLYQSTTVVSEYNDRCTRVQSGVVLEYNPTYKENIKTVIKEKYICPNQEKNKKNDALDNQKNKKEKFEKIKEELEIKFDEFWKCYPKKVGKPVALKAWLKIKPNDALFAEILEALKKHKKLEQWKKDKGQYIPNPATWINQHRWEDEIDGAIPDAAGDNGDVAGSWDSLANRYELFGLSDDED